MNNRIYISGKISGDSDYKAKFKSAQYEIEQARRSCSQQSHCSREQCIFYSRAYIYGCTVKDIFPDHFEVVNPTTFPVVNKPRWLAMMYCIMKLITCSYVFMLSDWRDSRGAKREHRWAKRLHKRIIYQQHTEQ